MQHSHNTPDASTHNVLLQIPSRWATAAFVLTSIVAGLFVTLYYGQPGRPSVTWMNIYPMQFYHDVPLSALPDYFLDQRSGIPPVLAFNEIVAIKLFGTTDPITVYAYHLALVATYAMAVAFANRNVLVLYMATTLAVIFQWATVLIHPGNPEVYDIFFGFYVMVAVWALRLLNKPGQKRPIVWAAVAGLALSLAELSRPFFLLVLLASVPLLVWLLARFERRVWVAFLVPLAVFSGGWHAKLLIFNDGQVVWSNHSGENIYIAWGKIIPFEPEAWTPPHLLNSQMHYERTQRRQREFIAFVTANPLESAGYMRERVWDFTYGLTDLYGNEPRHPVLAYYQRLPRIMTGVLLLNVCLLAVRLAVQRRQFTPTATDMLLWMAFLTLVLLAIGEHGEEARLLLTVLPFYVALCYPYYERAEVL